MKQLRSLYRVARKSGIPVDSFPLPRSASLSLADSDGRCYIALDPRQVESLADEKVKLAHELGHCETGSFYNPWSPLDIPQKHENRADHWAYQQLLPLRLLESAFRKGIVQPWELAEYFDLPESFVRGALAYYRQRAEAQTD